MEETRGWSARVRGGASRVSSANNPGDELVEKRWPAVDVETESNDNGASGKGDTPGATVQGRG